MLNSHWTNTMYRCQITRTVLVFLALLALCLGAQAQMRRNLPPNSLRGSMTFRTASDVTLNGNAVRLAPGSRIHGQNNMLVMSGALAGQSYKVNYILDFQGLLKDVWLLRDDEAARTWPTTAKEAATWTFDPLTQAWSQP